VSDGTTCSVPAILVRERWNPVGSVLIFFFYSEYSGILALLCLPPHPLFWQSWRAKCTALDLIRKDPPPPARAL
jgi:hypothetical protein